MVSRNGLINSEDIFGTRLILKNLLNPVGLTG